MGIGELQQRLHAETGLCATSLEPIICGVINRSFKVSTNEGDFILKYLVDEGFTQRDRPKQFRLQAIMAEVGFASEPIFLSTDNLLHLERWVEGESLELTDLTWAEKVEQAAILLARLHQTDVSAIEQCPKLDLPADWLNYFRFVGQTPNQDQMQAINQAKAILQRYPELVLCHNDPAYAHMMYGQDTCLLLDWEYSALANRYFDLAAFGLINQLIPNHLQLFLKRYAQHSRLELSQVSSGYNDFVPVVELTNRLWFMAAEHQQTLSN